jgi:peroxiredoxin
MSKRKIPLLVCAACGALVAHCVAQTAPLPVSPLAKAKTIRVTATFYQNGPDGKMVSASSSVVTEAGGKLTVRRTDLPTAPYKRQTLPEVLCDDGKALYELDGDRNVYYKAASPDWAHWPRPDPLYFYDLSRLDVVLHPDMPLDPKADPARLERTVSEGVLDGRPMQTITITTRVKVGEGAPMAMTQIDQLYTDKATGLPFRVVVTRTINGETKELSHIDFTGWVLDRPVPPQQFVWAVPAGAKLYVKPVVKQKPLLAVGTPAPDFAVLTPDGKTVHLSDYRGKTVVLDFWATWCGPCQASMPHLEHVYQQVKTQNVAVLGVCVWDDKAAYDKWVPLHMGKEYNFPVAFDPSGRGPKSIAGSLYKVTGIPTQYVIDKDGKVAASGVGYEGESDHRLEANLSKQGIDIAVPSKTASAK